MNPEILEKAQPFQYHRFLDEAGDTTFYGQGKTPILGQTGVSNAFILGMVKFKSALQPVRERVLELQERVAHDRYFQEIPSIQKKKSASGFFFHAKDDIPEVRKIFYEFIRSLNCSFEAVVGRKILNIFLNKHNGKDVEFYADLLSHLLKNKLTAGPRLVLNIAQRGQSTKNAILQMAFDKALVRFRKKHPEDGPIADVTFNVQNHTTEPLLNIADYFCWAVQRVFERGEMRYYNYLSEQISLVIDLYDSSKWEGSKNYYTRNNPLTPENKTSPRLH